MGKWTTADIPSQAGKRALITGANSGIGFHAARHLAIAGCTVVLGCRDLSKGEQARQRIKQETPAADVELAELDLASLESIHALADGYITAGKPLDLLINNAGVMALPTRQLTKDGFERQFGTNHLGHFALTGRLLPLLLAAPAARIVTVSSIAHQSATMRFDDLQFETGYKPWAPYKQSKLANLLFAFELQRRLENAGAKAISVAVHPGLSNTSIFKNGPGGSPGLKNYIAPVFFKFAAQTEEQGSFPTLYGATSPDAIGGGYYGPEGFLEWRGAPVEVAAKLHAHDQAAAARLWRVSEGLTDVRYTAIDGD